MSIVDLATPQNLVAAWGMNAEYHFVFTRQNRGKLLALKALCPACWARWRSTVRLAHALRDTPPEVNAIDPAR